MLNGGIVLCSSLSLVFIILSVVAAFAFWYFKLRQAPTAPTATRPTPPPTPPTTTDPGYSTLSCQQLQSQFGIVAKTTWGSAPVTAQSVWLSKGCDTTTAPTTPAPDYSAVSCQQLQSQFGIVPDVSWGIAPTDAQSAWYSKGCDNAVAPAPKVDGAICGASTECQTGHCFACPAGGWKCGADPMSECGQWALTAEGAPIGTPPPPVPTTTSPSTPAQCAQPPFSRGGNCGTSVVPSCARYDAGGNVICPAIPGIVPDPTGKYCTGDGVRIAVSECGHCCHAGDWWPCSDCNSGECLEGPCTSVWGSIPFHAGNCFECS